MFEETIEVRDPMNLDELTKKEFSFTVDYSESIEHLIKRSENVIERSDMSFANFKIPRGKKGKRFKITAQIFPGLNHRNILAEMQEKGYFGANIFEAAKFSIKYPHIQHQITFFVPAEERYSDCYNNVHSICFSVNKYKDKIISRDIIHFDDKSKNVEIIYLLGVKVEEIMEE